MSGIRSGIIIFSSASSNTLMLLSHAWYGQASISGQSLSSQKLHEEVDIQFRPYQDVCPSYIGIKL